MKQHSITEPFFLTEEVEAKMVAAGYEFEPPIACTGRLRDVLALQPGEIAGQERRQNKQF